MNKILCVTLISLFLLQLSHGQKSLDIGNFKKLEHIDEGLLVEAENGFVEIQVYDPMIIRLRANRTGTFDDFSYALVVEPKKVELSFDESDNEMILRTSSLIMVISKRQVRISFYSPEGKLINGDSPELGIRFLGDQTYVHKLVPSGEKIIGLGEKTGPLNKAGRSYTNWNSDTPGYGIYSDPLYVTIPFYIGVHDSLAYGIYIDNSWQTDFSFGSSNEKPTYFNTTGGDMDYFFIRGGDVKEVIQNYTWLTGRMPLPPIWSLGLHQSRWSYYPDKEVLNIARTFREKNFPADVMTLDIHYMDDYKIFTWHPSRFPDPGSMIDELRRMGFHTTVILDPGIKIEKGYPTWKSGLEQDIYVKNPGGKTLFAAQVWPGWCHFPDFTDARARVWWGDQMKGLCGLGIRGFWNDMNEPATWSKNFLGLAEHSFEGTGAVHLRAHNVYGMQMARASYEGSLHNSSDERPFILTRAGFSGIQRYAAVWTGDNVSSDEHLLLGCRMLASMGLAGLSFTGMDTGGFSGEPEQSSELFARWCSIGAFTPFFRIHAARNTRAQEPWAFGEWAEETALHYTRLRYRLLPYIYSVFYESTQDGVPVMRAMAVHYPYDELVYDPRFENQFFLGPYILVAPVASSQQFAEVYLPSEGYYDLVTGEFYVDRGPTIVESPNRSEISKLPVFVKAGGILPMQPVVNHTGEKPDTLIVHVFYGEENTRFMFYCDDGVSFKYREGDYHRRMIRWSPSQMSVILEEAEGKYVPGYKMLVVVMHGFPGGVTGVRVNGRHADFKQEGSEIRTPTDYLKGKIILNLQ